MKKVKQVKEFFFKNMEKEDLVNEINTDLPLQIKLLEPLIDRIYKRYPIIDKTEISVIVKAALEEIRSFLILGNIINFNKFVFDMKFLFFKHMEFPALKVHIKTPPELKDLE